MWQSTGGGWLLDFNGVRSFLKIHFHVCVIVYCEQVNH